MSSSGRASAEPGHRAHHLAESCHASRTNEPTFDEDLLRVARCVAHVRARCWGTTMDRLRSEPPAKLLGRRVLPNIGPSRAQVGALCEFDGDQLAGRDTTGRDGCGRGA